MKSITTIKLKIRKNKILLQTMKKYSKAVQYIANKGFKNSAAKLNEFQRRIIRRLCDLTAMRNPEIAEYFPVSSSHISNLRANRIWKL